MGEMTQGGSSSGGRVELRTESGLVVGVVVLEAVRQVATQGELLRLLASSSEPGGCYRKGWEITGAT